MAEMGTIPQTLNGPASLSAVRSFGSEFAPPRQLYLLFLPGTLSFIGILSWTLGNEAGMVMAAAVGGLVGVFSLWDWLFRKAPTRFSTLMGMTLLLGYAGGAFNTWATLPRGHLSLAESLGLDPAMLARAIGAVLISAASLYFLGEIFEKPVFGLDFRLYIDHKTRILIYAGTLAILAGVLTHTIGFSGAGVGHLTIPGFFLYWLCAPLTSFAVAAFLKAEGLMDRVLSGLAALFLITLFTIAGRRAAIYTSIEIVLVLGLAGYNWRRQVFRKLLLLLVLSSIIVASSLTFMLLRIAGGLNPHKHLSVGGRIAIADKLVHNGTGFAMASSTTQQNVQTRTFVLAFFANILGASSRMQPAFGMDAVNLMKIAVPGILLPNKDFPSEEELVDQQFGFNYNDEANSVLTAGATDFGLIGVVFYPLIIAAVFALYFRFLERWFKPVPLMFIALCFILSMLQTETTLTGYFEALRDAPLFASVLAIFLAVPFMGGGAMPGRRQA